MQYNAALAFTSLGVKVDDSVVGHGPPVFQIHGVLKHFSGSLLLEESVPPLLTRARRDTKVIDWDKDTQQVSTVMYIQVMGNGSLADYGRAASIVQPLCDQKGGKKQPLIPPKISVNFHFFLVIFHSICGGIKHHFVM